MSQICRCAACERVAEAYHAEAMDKLLLAADAWWDAWAKQERWTVWANDPRPEAAFADEFGPDTDEDVIRDALTEAESNLIEATREAKRDTESIITLKSAGAL